MDDVLTGTSIELTAGGPALISRWRLACWDDDGHPFDLCGDDDECERTYCRQWARVADTAFVAWVEAPEDGQSGFLPCVWDPQDEEIVEVLTTRGKRFRCQGWARRAADKALAEIIRRHQGQRLGAEEG